MSNLTFRDHVSLGRTGLRVSRIGLAGGYGVPAAAVEKAFHEDEVNYLYWEGRKKRGMRDALRNLVPFHRSELVIAIQSYDHLGIFLRRSVEKALRELKLDHADIVFLGWFNKMPSQRILDLGHRLMDEGKVRFLGVTGHNRLFHGKVAREEGAPFDVLQVRYSAAHRGAEKDVFEGLPESRPGITTYTATRWGRLLQASKMPPGEKPLTAAECYRFVLSHPAADVCLAGPKSSEEMEEGLKALSHGPLHPEAMKRVRRIGDYVHG